MCTLSYFRTRMPDTIEGKGKPYGYPYSSIPEGTDCLIRFHSLCQMDWADKSCWKHHKRTQMCCLAMLYHRLSPCIAYFLLLDFNSSTWAHEQRRQYGLCTRQRSRVEHRRRVVVQMPDALWCADPAGSVHRGTNINFSSGFLDHIFLLSNTYAVPSLRLNPLFISDSACFSLWHSSAIWRPRALSFLSAN